MKGLHDFGLLGAGVKLIRDRRHLPSPAPSSDPRAALTALGHDLLLGDAARADRLQPSAGPGVALRVVTPEALETPWAPADPADWSLTCDGRRYRLAPPGGWFRCVVLDAAVGPEWLGPLLGPGAFGWRRGEPTLWPRVTRRRPQLRDRLVQAARAALNGSTPQALIAELAERLEVRAAFADVPLDLLHADVLGRVHEALLGELRRERGSYYTPPALARALVEVCLGPLVDAAPDLDAIERLRVLDPAAGGGQVLQAALERLTRAWIERAPAGDFPDVVAVRRRLATRCLAAADRDAGAIETARLSLGLACGDRGLTLPDLRVGDALLEVHPDEADVDVVNHTDRSDRAAARGAWQAAVDAGGDGAAEAAALERARADASAPPAGGGRARHGARPVVHWRRVFPDGFDVVLGNPPYHRETSGAALFQDVRAARLGRHARSKGDLWFFFTHLALELLRPGGRHGFVVPGYWLKATGAGPRHLRAALRPLRWTALIDLDRLPVFRAPGGRRVAGRHVVFCVANEAPAGAVAVYRVSPGPVSTRLADLRRALAGGAAAGVRRSEVAPETLHDEDGKLLVANALSSREHTLLRRLRNGALPRGWTVSEGVTANPERVTARAVARVRDELGVDLAARGVAPGDPVFVVPADWPGLAALPDAERERLVPYLRHEAVARLRAGPGGDDPLLIYTTRDTAGSPEEIPHLTAHLGRAREIMELRRETRRGRRAWYQLHWPRAASLLDGERVLVPRMTTWPAAAWTADRCATGESVYTIVPPERGWASLVAALLNALPFALGILLTTKPRGKGVDIPRAALTGCPWPGAEALADPPGPLCEALSAAERLGELPEARCHEGPWWSHPEPAVAEAGRALDEAVCRWLDVSYDGLRALAERRPC